MKRLFAVALIASLGLPSIAFAEGPIAQSAGKSLRETTVRSVTPPSGRFVSYATKAGVRSTPPAATLAQQGNGGTISQTGLSKRTKTIIFAAVAAGFLGTAYGIDHRVRDVTPSSLGTREDNSVFGK